MKLKTFDKIMLIILMLLTMGLCIFFIYFMWANFPGEYIGKEIGKMYDLLVNKLIITAVSAIVFVLCVRILFIRKRSGKGQEKVQASTPGLLIRTGDSGSAYLTNSALEGMILKCVRGNAKVRDCVCAIIPNENNVSISLRITFVADVVLPEATQEVQSELKENIESLTGITVRDIQVLVEAPEKQIAISGK